MNKKNIIQWGIVYLTPYLVISCAFINKGIAAIYLPMFYLGLSSTVGVYAGVFSTAQAYTFTFKAYFVIWLLLSISIFVIGYLKRQNFWGKALNAFGIYLWCIGGMVALSYSS